MNSAFVQALEDKIGTEMNRRPSSAVGTIVEVDPATMSCKVRIPNPTGPGTIVVDALLPTTPGLFSSIPKRWQRAVLSFPQGNFMMASITALRPVDDTYEDPAKNRTSEAGVKAKAEAKIGAVAANRAEAALKAAAKVPGNKDTSNLLRWDVK